MGAAGGRKGSGTPAGKKKIKKCKKAIDISGIVCYNHTCAVGSRQFGEVSEWFKELVLKTSDSERDRGFESHLLRF